MQQYQEMNLAKMTRTCERIPQKRQMSWTGISRDLRFMVGWLSIRWFEESFSLQFLCFDSCFPRLWKFLVTFGIATFIERNLHLFPVELTIYYARFLGSYVFFQSITCQRTGLLLKEEIFVTNIPLAWTFAVFSSPEPKAQVSFCHSAPSVVRP